jgi:hypothetical protein
MSAEARKRIGDSKRGNTYRLGSTHSESVRERLKSAAERPESVAMWDAFRKLGPKASSKRVVCLDDGLEFESASAAARHYGLDKGALTQVCCRDPKRKCVGDLVFRYYGDHHGGKTEADQVRAERLQNRRNSGLQNAANLRLRWEVRA